LISGNMDADAVPGTPEWHEDLLVM
jgi:hypothetical protein